MNTVIERIRKALRLPQGGVDQDTRVKTVFAKTCGWSDPMDPVGPDALPELLASIRTEAAHLNLQVHECTDPVECARELAALVRDRRPEWGARRRIMCWNDPALKALKLEDLLADSDIALDYVPDRDVFDQAERAAFRERIEGSYVGVTTADWLIADTATLVLLGGRGRARSVSLVPSIHVAVVSVRCIVPTFRDVLRRLDRQGLTLPSNLTLVTGPSKTADIEATLVHGAHGPREMHLFLTP